MELMPMKEMSFETWDGLISQFGTKSLFHESAWLEFIENTQGGEKVLLEIREVDKVVGYFVGFILQKGPFRILGSPLTGWTTRYMGPIVNENFDQTQFLGALERYCKHLKIHQLEFCSPVFNPEIPKSQGFRFTKGITPIMDLSVDEETLWRSLPPKSCRYAIRKALKNGLVVEDTESSQIVDEYYNQLVEVFAGKGLVPTYPLDRVQGLFECLKGRDMLFALRVKYGDKVIAVGLFPHDNRCVYFWGGASYSEFRHLYPNELIQWTLMQMAIKRGISKYDMFGGSNKFKTKFGAKLIDTYHWYKSYNAFAGIARFTYQQQFRILQRFRGLVKKTIR